MSKPKFLPINMYIMYIYIYVKCIHTHIFYISIIWIRCIYMYTYIAQLKILWNPSGITFPEAPFMMEVAERTDAAPRWKLVNYQSLAWNMWRDILGYWCVTHVHIFTNTYMYTYKCICIYIYIYVYIYIYTYAYVYIYALFIYIYTLYICIIYHIYVLYIIYMYYINTHMYISVYADVPFGNQTWLAGKSSVKV